MDYTKPLLVPAGSDALGQIGKLAGCGMYVLCIVILSFQAFLPSQQETLEKSVPGKITCNGSIKTYSFCF